jgi:hypothetical protein
MEKISKKRDNKKQQKVIEQKNISKPSKQDKKELKQHQQKQPSKVEKKQKVSLHLFCFGSA